MTVTHVSQRDFKQRVLRSEVPAVVDFYADWCGPCKQVSPAVEALSEEWNDEVRFFKLDIDRNPQVAAAFRVRSIPAILLFEDGKPVGWSIGAKPGYVIEKELGLAKRKRKLRKEQRRAQGGGFLRRRRGGNG